MNPSRSCPRCSSPVGVDDRLCWNCGETVEVAAAVVAHGELGPTVDRSNLPSPAELFETPAIPVVAAEEPEDRATRLVPALAGFCGDCGSSYDRFPAARFCGSCGASRSSSPAPLPAMMRPSLTSAEPPAVADPQPSPPVEAGASDWSPDPVSLWRSIGPIDRSWSGRVKRGWEITKLSLDLMKRQPGLIAVPFVVAAVIGVLFILMALITHGLPSGLQLVFWIPTLAVMASVSMTGQAVITQRVATVVDGGSQTNHQALSAVGPRLRDICLWGILSATVGMAIRSLGRGRGLLGVVMRIIGIALAIAWTSMTFFVLPVILFERLTVGAAIRRSKQLVRTCWGEGIVGVGILNALFNLVGFVGILLGFLFVFAGVWVLGLLIILATIVGFNVLAAIVSPVFTLVLYRYATTGQVELGFSVSELAAAFRPQKVKAG